MKLAAGSKQRADDFGLRIADLKRHRAWSIEYKARSQESEPREVPVQGARCMVQGKALKQKSDNPLYLILR